MKYSIQVTSLDHEDIVNILACTVYGSTMVGVRYDDELWDSLEEGQKTPNPCIEDKCADLLLAGKHINLFDPYYEEYACDQSSIRTGYLDEKEELGGMTVMQYDITLKDFLDAANSEAGADFIKDFAEECDDQWTSEGFLQVVMFGEVVYG